MLFSKKKKDKNLPRAVAFVDYEHWYISLEKIYGLRPNIDAWFNDLKKRCILEEVIFFGNFSKFKEKEKETKRIRAFTNKIIDTFNPDSHFKKDYTDFIILDNIYQKAFSNNGADLFIIFSGDGHFSSVAAFLRNFCNKKVGIYSVKGGLNNNLMKSADWIEQVPYESDFVSPIHNYIFTSLKENENKTNILTFMRMSEIISQKYNVEKEVVQKELSELIKQGYIKQMQEGSGLRILNVDWQKVNKDNIWIKDAVLLKPKPIKQ